MAKFTFMPDVDGCIDLPFEKYLFRQKMGSSRSHLVPGPYASASTLCGFSAPGETTDMGAPPGYPFAVCPKCARIALSREAQKGGE